jgi:nucleoside-diphosphate-sugar epimerase
MKLSRADVSKASQLLGYRPAFGLAAGLERTTDWYIAELAPAAERTVAHV